MFAPAMLPSGAKLMRMNFPNLLELLFRCVCALPNASKIGFACKICRSSSPSRPFAVKPEPGVLIDTFFPCFFSELFLGSPVFGMIVPDEADESDCECEWDAVACGGCVSVAIAARYCMTFLVLSVFPAPDSPLELLSATSRPWQSLTYVIRILWFSRSSPMLIHARSAIAKICGGFSSRRLPRYWCTIASE